MQRGAGARRRTVLPASDNNPSEAGETNEAEAASRAPPCNVHRVGNDEPVRERHPAVWAGQRNR